MTMIQSPYQLTYDDYAQSANTLFHFMKKPEFLKEILQKRAIIPRYCKENLKYLNIHNNGTPYPEVYVLQKCFCDIPFHKLMERFELKGEGDNYQKLTDEEKKTLPESYTHLDFYGKYAIAFSKSWGEKNNLQPVHYLNEQSQYTRDFSNLIGHIMQAEDVPDLYADDILYRLCFVKPLRGPMKRRFRRSSGEELEIEYYKNFHDEQEWRFVPGIEALTSVKKEYLIANPHMLRMNEGGRDINEVLTREQYSVLWLQYRYEEIRYIIVPDDNARIDIIRTIMSIPDDRFEEWTDVLTQKYILISKILVLDEIGKDW